MLALRDGSTAMAMPKPMVSSMDTKDFFNWSNLACHTASWSNAPTFAGACVPVVAAAGVADVRALEGCVGVLCRRCGRMHLDGDCIAVVVVVRRESIGVGVRV
jgi:hypothetical protein